MKILPLRNLFPRRPRRSRFVVSTWSGREDLNLRPPSPEPGALARLRYAPNRRHCNTEERGASMIPCGNTLPRRHSPASAQPLPSWFFYASVFWSRKKKSERSRCDALFLPKPVAARKPRENPNYTKRPLLFSQRSHTCGRSPLSLAPRHAILYYVGKILRGSMLHTVRTQSRTDTTIRNEVSKGGFFCGG